MISGDGVCARVQNSQLFVVYTIMMTSWMIHLCKAIKEEVLVLKIPGGSRISQRTGDEVSVADREGGCWCKNTSR